MMTDKRNLKSDSQWGRPYPTFAEARPHRSPAIQFAGRLSQCTRRHVPQDQPWPTRQKRILCVGWAPPDLRYVTKKEVQLKGGGTVELTVLDSSSPKLTDPPEGRVCKL